MVADRTVTVRLELDVASYLAHLREAQTATKAFGDGATTANEKADTSTKKLTKDVKDTGTAMGDAEKTAKTLGTATKDAGDKADNSAKSWSGLKNEIEDTRKHMLGLMNEFARTGDKTVLSRITGDRSDLQRLESINKEMERLEKTNNRFSIPVVGSGLSRTFLAGANDALQSFQDLLQKAPPVVSIPIVIGAVSFAAAAISAVGAAISAAVLAVVGGGVLAGGIALAWSDPQVVLAMQRFKVEAIADLKDAASQGLGDGLTASIRSASRGISELAPAIQQTFSTLSPALEDLVHGIVGMLGRLFNSSGWQLAMGEAARIITQIGNELPYLGDAIAVFFGSMARAGPGAEAFLRMFFSWLEGSVMFTGFLVEGLSKVFKVASDIFSFLIKSDMLGPLGILADKFGLLGQTGEKSFHQLKDSAKEVVPAIEIAQTAQEKLNETLITTAGRASNYKAVMDLLFKTQQDVIGGNIDYHDKLISLDDALKANGNTVDINTRKGVDNLKAIKDVAEAIVKERDNNIANGLTIEQANKIRDDEIRKLLDDARQHGILTDEVRKLINTYGEIPVNKNTNVTITGAARVYEDLINLKSAQLALAQNIDVSQARKEVAGQIGGGFVGHAAGGYIDGPGTKTSDSIPIMASKGEFVEQAAAVDYYGVGLMQALNLRKIPRWMLEGFAGGGVIDTGIPGGWGGDWPMSVDASHTNLVTTLARIQAQFISTAGASGVLGQWIQAAMLLTGVPASWAGPLSVLIGRESGGNPRSINLTDINAQMGDPSRGLMQTIGATFNAYHWPGTSYDIYDPVANIAAGINYILHRYGSIFSVQQANPNLPPMGYGVGGLVQSFDQGGMLRPGFTLAYNGTGRPERVSGGGGGGGVTINNLNVTAPVGSSGIDIGRQVVSVIKKYERAAGTIWRS